MALGYEFINLNQEQKDARRELLNYYPEIAQFSILPILVLFQVVFFFSWIARRGRVNPGSPSLARPKERRSILRSCQRGSDKTVWWLKGPIVAGWDWGTRAEWIFGSIWTIWLLYLCIVRTGNDYLHLTKRFGIIGASQLPFHYLLAMRSPYSPVQYLTRLSHEELKVSHEILGKIICLLFSLHAAFYMNFFVLSGFLAKRIKDRDVILGIISFIMFSAMSTTALGQLRKWNYRVFYNTHVIMANLVVVALFFHVVHIRPYVYQVIIVTTIHQILRHFSFRVYSGSIKVLPGTNLVQMRVPLTANDSAVKWKPGQHVYLSRPSGYTSTNGAYDSLLMRNKQNPFTVASLPSVDKEVLLVARALDGNTKDLADLARKVAKDEVAEISLALEGPYGASRRLPDLSTFDKVLLVAGGVGATFLVPIYRSLLANADLGTTGSKVRFVWSVRTLGETQWAFPTLPGGEDSETTDDLQPHHDNVEVFVTRGSSASREASASDHGEDIELVEREQLLSLTDSVETPLKGMTVQAGRPELSVMVDEVFRKGHRVAVLCCGPKPLTEKMRQSVEKWSGKGYDVYWHDESFSW